MEGYMINLIRVLKNVDLFQSFSEDELDRIFNKNNYNHKSYKKNSIIYMQNEKCKTLDVILEGIISIQKIDSEGNMLSINDFSAGDIIGENLLFSIENKYPMTIMAKSDTEILHINKELILNLCQNNKNFLLAFLQSLSSKALILSSKIMSLSMKTLRQCIIDFLLFEYYAQNNLEIKLNMTKKDLAEKFGVQRSSLSRELSNMKKDGLIDFDAKYIIIKDINLLAKLHIEN
jgi:CRP-like cAMP-binding protein